jgi:trehalose 6-phosphate phosphatase
MPADIEELARTAAGAGLFFDFDGTLAPIVPRPEDARPLTGAREELERLGRIFKLVAVVSGRSADELAQWLGPQIEIWGLHGGQFALGGTVEIAPQLARFIEPMKTVLGEARQLVADAGVRGALVEDKHIMIGLHWRMAAEAGQAERTITAIARELAGRYRLEMGRGKMAVELKPPVEVSKKDVVVRRAREEKLVAAAFAGDDLVDLSAYDALDELAREGTNTIRIAVSSREAPSRLLEQADVIVQGPEGMLSWLQELRLASEGVAGSSPD